MSAPLGVSYDQRRHPKLSIQSLREFKKGNKCWVFPVGSSVNRIMNIDALALLYLISLLFIITFIHYCVLSAMDRNLRVAVVGAGATGLSTALCIQNRIRNCDVTIIADKFSPSTTSDGSAGLWTPFIVPDKQKEIVTQVFSTYVWKIIWKVISLCQLCKLLPRKMQNKIVW